MATTTPAAKPTGRPDDVDVIVDQWAREMPDLDTRSMEIFGRIYRLAGLMGDRLERAYGKHGISRAEFDVLATLRRAGAPHRLAPTDLARSMMITTGGMTGRLDRLVRAGLVERVPHPTDKRGVFAQLTEAGLDVIDSAVVAGVDAQSFVADQLGDAGSRELADHLREVLHVLETRRS
ncbi:MarR family winged helix-turn-helix transcriptional regulator [Micromonospora sp. 067-2]|uniref:MarR family winged helix-turn-helix transcriptional regulator n=1 Tax=Micromonospora sp. 067-2 TaxID=2789270 RepID=UPI00397A20AD